MATEGKFGRCASLRAPMATGIRADSVVAAAEPNVEMVVELVVEPVAEPVVEPVAKRMPVGIL